MMRKTAMPLVKKQGFSTKWSEFAGQPRRLRGMGFRKRYLLKPWAVARKLWQNRFRTNYAA